jgi:tryptophan halogenase
MNPDAPHLVILGGGTSGWLTAAYLARRLTAANGSGIHITLIEATDIPTIGVGEATVPSLRTTLAKMGVDEFEFMRECDATFKHGIKFRHWQQSPSENPENSFYHPFQRPVKSGFDSLCEYWLQGLDPYRRSFCDAVSVQPRVSDLGLAPKRLSDPPYDGPLPYAYHLDAGKLAIFLRKLAERSGVSRVPGTVARVQHDNNGAIKDLVLDDNTTISGDVFIDCSGYAALLIGQQMRQPLNDLSGILLCDRAVVCQVPYAIPDAPVRPYTLASAQTAGWIWDIGLTSRRGTGYVYSSRHCSDAQAETTLRDYLGPAADGEPCRILPMTVGYRERQWVQNCVALGLAAGFLEPLESTGIHLVELALYTLESLLPRYLNGGTPQHQFNRLMREQYEISVEFIKLHYYLSQRRDSTFWQDNTRETSAPAKLKEKLRNWQNSYPDRYDIHTVHSVFDHMGYQYIYFGMGRRPEVRTPLRLNNPALASRAFTVTHQALEKATTTLPPHRELLQAIRDASPAPK